MKQNNQFDPNNPWSDRTRALARQHHAEGLSSDESAALLGPPFNRNMVVGFRYRAGLKKLPAPLPPPKPPPKPKPLPSSFKAMSGPRAALPKPRPPKADGAPPETARPWATRTRRECCWPVGGRGADTLYCCASITQENDQGWCETHAAIGYSAAMTAGWRPRRLSA